MKPSHKTPAEAELALRKIESKLVDIHNTFSSIFPNSIKEEQFGKKILILARIRIKGSINTNNLEELFEQARITRKTNKRNYTEKLLQELKEQELIQTTEKENIIVLTNKGRYFLECLEEYTNKINNTELEYKIIKNSSYFEYAKIEITTDGIETNMKWTWKIKNKTEKEIEKINIGIAGTLSINNELNFKHSENIKRYEHTIDDFMRKRIDLHFKEPIKNNQNLEYWYSYDWNSIYKTGQTPWEFFISLRTYPAKQIIILFKLKKIKIKEETTTIDYNIIDKTKSTNTGEHAIMPLITRELESYNETK